MPVPDFAFLISSAMLRFAPPMLWAGLLGALFSALSAVVEQ